MIRPPTTEEIGRLQEIEVVAGRAFVDVGLPEVASDEQLFTLASGAEEAAHGLDPAQRVAMSLAV